MNLTGQVMQRGWLHEIHEGFSKLPEIPGAFRYFMKFTQIGEIHGVPTAFCRKYSSVKFREIPCRVEQESFILGAGREFVVKFG